MALVAILALDIAAGLALHAYGGYRFGRAVEELEELLGKRVDLDLSRFHRPSVPDRDNAILGFAAAAQVIELSRNERTDLTTAEKVPMHAWPLLPALDGGAGRPPIEFRLRNVLTRNRRALELLHQAAERRRSSYGLSFSGGRHSPVPNLLFALTEARLLAAEARLAFADGDEAGGLRAARSLARLAVCLDEEHPSIFHFVAIGVEAILDRLALEAATAPEGWAARSSLHSGLAAILPAGDRSAHLEEKLLFDALERSQNVRDRRRSLPWRVVSPVWSWIQGPLEASSILAGQRQVIKLARRPIGRLFEDRRFSLDRHLPVAAGQEASFYEALACQMIASETQLARASLALRIRGLAEGGYPERRPDLSDLRRREPFMGRLLGYRPLEDGSLRLEVEGATEILGRIDSRPPRYDFRVRLPGPEGASGAGTEGRGERKNRFVAARRGAQAARGSFPPRP